MQLFLSDFLEKKSKITLVTEMNARRWFSMFINLQQLNIVKYNSENVNGGLFIITTSYSHKYSPPEGEVKVK